MGVSNIKILKSKNLSLKKGFTLVELLVVMGILAVLAGALVVLLDPSERLKLATDTKAIADATQVTGALQSYAAQAGGIYYFSGGSSWDNMTTRLKTDGFLTVAPTVQGNYAFNYYVDATGANAKVVTNLTSKKNGGTTGCWCWSSAVGTASVKSSCNATATTCP